MNSLRRIPGISRRDEIRNDVIRRHLPQEHTSTWYTAKTDFLEQISIANLRFFIHPNFAFLSGPNKVDLRGISKLIEVK